MARARSHAGGGGATKKPGHFPPGTSIANGFTLELWAKSVSNEIANPFNLELGAKSVQNELANPFTI